MILSRIFPYPVARSWQSHLKESCIVLGQFLDKVLAWILVRSEKVLSQSWQDTCQDLIKRSYQVLTRYLSSSYHFHIQFICTLLASSYQNLWSLVLARVNKSCGKKFVIVKKNVLHECMWNTIECGLKIQTRHENEDTKEDAWLN